MYSEIDRLIAQFETVSEIDQEKTLAQIKSEFSKEDANRKILFKHLITSYLENKITPSVWIKIFRVIPANIPEYYFMPYKKNNTLEPLLKSAFETNNLLALEQLDLVYMMLKFNNKNDIIQLMLVNVLLYSNNDDLHYQHQILDMLAKYSTGSENECYHRSILYNDNNNVSEIMLYKAYAKIAAQLAKNSKKSVSYLNFCAYLQEKLSPRLYIGFIDNLGIYLDDQEDALNLIKKDDKIADLKKQWSIQKNKAKILSDTEQKLLHEVQQIKVDLGTMTPDLAIVDLDTTKLGNKKADEDQTIVAGVQDENEYLLLIGRLNDLLSMYSTHLEEALTRAKKHFDGTLGQTPEACAVAEKQRMVLVLKTILANQTSLQPSECVKTFYKKLNKYESELGKHRDPFWKHFVYGTIITAGILITGLLPGLIALLVYATNVRSIRFWGSSYGKELVATLDDINPVNQNKPQA